MATEQVLLVRHGESEANSLASEAETTGADVIPVRQRDPDVPLSSLGERQATALDAALRAQLGDALRGARVWSSPYRRAAQTAELALPARSLFRTDERLRDRELGVIDALTRKGVATMLPAEARRREWLGKFYYRPPGGESWPDVALRIRSFVRDLDWQDDRPVIVFTHDAVISLVVYVLTGLSETELNALIETPIGNASVTTLMADPEGQWQLDRYGDDRHLLAAGLPTTDQPRIDDAKQA